MSYVPLRDKVLLEETEKATVTESGIYLGDARADNNTRPGRVLAVGPEVSEIKAGDIVYVMWQKSHIIKEGDKLLAIVGIDDIIAVLED